MNTFCFGQISQENSVTDTEHSCINQETSYIEELKDKLWGTKQMAQSIKCLWHKHEDLSSNPQHTIQILSL